MGLQWVDLSVIAVKEIRVEKGLVNLNVPVTQSIAIKVRKIWMFRLLCLAILLQCITDALSFHLLSASVWMSVSVWRDRQHLGDWNAECLLWNNAGMHSCVDCQTLKVTRVLWDTETDLLAVGHWNGGVLLWDVLKLVRLCGVLTLVSLPSSIETGSFMWSTESGVFTMEHWN